MLRTVNARSRRLPTLAVGMVLSLVGICATQVFETHAQGISDVIVAAQRQTDEYRKQIIQEGPCEGKYPAIPSGSLVVSADALNAIDPATLSAQVDQLNAEISKLREQRISEKTALAKVKMGQKDAVFAWLQTEYGLSPGKSMLINLEDRTYVITPWLFGTFVENYPTQIPANQGRKIQVTFTPAVFSAGLRSGMRIRPSRYGGAAIPDSLQFTPRDVTGVSDQTFQLGQWEDVDPQKSITWTWEAKPSSEFNGADFDVIMQAMQSGAQTTHAQTAADLPIKIGLEPEDPFWKRHDAVIAAIVGAIIGGFFTGLFTRWLTR